MKFAKITLSVALLGALTLGMADDARTTESTSVSTSADSQIAAIQAAPAEERVQMMNEFKQRLANMNQQERMDTIAKMQEKMHGKMQEKSAFGSTTHEQAHDAKDKGSEMGEMTKERAHEMVHAQQAQTNEQMSHMQNMNQMQAGNQFMHENGHTSSTQMNGSSNGGSNGGSNYNMNMRH